MRHVLFEVPGLGWDVPGYGVALMIGFLLSVWWAARRAERSGANPDIVLNCGFIALLGGVVGARAMYVLHYWEQFAGRSNLLWALIDVRKGGLEVYGGVLAVMVVVFVYLWRSKLSIRWYLDIMVPSAALGMGLGRIGCFLNGCCYGGVCDLPWAVRFPYGSSAAVQQWEERMPGAALPQQLVFMRPQGVYGDGTAAVPVSRELGNPGLSEAEIAAEQEQLRGLLSDIGAIQQEVAQASTTAERTRLKGRLDELRGRIEAVGADHIDIRTQMEKYGLSFEELREVARPHRSLPVHPTQLYSVVVLVILALFLDAIYWRRTRDGQVLFAFLLVEPIMRWMLEVIRADNPIDTLGTFTISQFIAIGMSLVGLIGLLVLRKLPPRSPRAKIWEPPPATTAPGKAKAGTLSG